MHIARHRHHHEAALLLAHDQSYPGLIPPPAPPRGASSPVGDRGGRRSSTGIVILPCLLTRAFMPSILLRFADHCAHVVPGAVHRRRARPVRVSTGESGASWEGVRPTLLNVPSAGAETWAPPTAAPRGPLCSDAQRHGQCLMLTTDH